MKSLQMKDYNSYNVISPNQKNNLDISHALSLKNNHLLINCKSQLKVKHSELIVIRSLWNDLGVNLEYQKEFDKYFKELKNEQEKKELLNYERNHLRKFRDALIKLSEEISNRDNNIYKLKKYCIELDNYSCVNSKNYDNNNKEFSNEEENNDNEGKIQSNLFDLIQICIKNYRINTANIINRIMKVREISSYYESIKKWEPSKINRSYSFKKNYIFTMKDDIEFLNNSSLLNYIQIDKNTSDIDLFLSNWKYIIRKDNKKLNISPTFELQSEISKCKYIMLQDNLLNQIENNKKTYIKRSILSPKSRPVHSVESSYNSRHLRKEIHLSNERNEKRYYEMFGHNKVNLSRTLYYLKKTMGNKYGNMFYYDSGVLNNVKKNNQVMNKYFQINNNNDIYDYNDENNENDDDIKDVKIIDNNRDYMMNYFNTKKINNRILPVFSNETNSNYTTEQIRKNNEDSKIIKKVENNNIHYEKNNYNKINNQRKKEKKNQKNEKSEYSKEKRDKKIKKEKNVNKKDENIVSIRKIINTDSIIIKSEETKKRKKNLKKFSSDNIKIENAINVIIENKKEEEKNNEIVGNNENSKILGENAEINHNEIKLENKNEENMKNNNDINNIMDKKTDELKESTEKKEENNNDNESYTIIKDNSSKCSEDKYVSKIKLLHYRQYTEEEIDEYNKDYDKFF